jgi:hypothetical protein
MASPLRAFEEIPRQPPIGFHVTDYGFHSIMAPKLLLDGDSNPSFSAGSPH